MGRFIRVQVEVDREGLIDAYLAYLTDPRPSRNEHHEEVLDEGPIPPMCLEAMVLDGVDRREDVAEFVDYCLQNPWSLAAPRPASRPPGASRAGTP